MGAVNWWSFRSCTRRGLRSVGGSPGSRSAVRWPPPTVVRRWDHSSMPRQRHPEIDGLFVRAAESVIPAPGREPWTYGWGYADYRRSPEAALDSPDGPVTMSDDGRQAFEQALEALLKEDEINLRWEVQDFWFLMASFAVHLAGVQDRPSAIASGLRRVRTAPRALVVLPLANVSWNGPPVALADVLLGLAQEDFIRGTANLGEQQDPSIAAALEEYIDDRLGHDAPVVLFACRTEGQGHLAVKQAERRLHTVLDLIILMGVNRPEYGYSSQRSPVNRPGIRGLAIDREAMEKHLDARGGAELAAQPFVSSPMGVRQSVHWYSADPLRLDLFVSRP